jgi:lipoyl(octanoyl) transferase
MSTLAAPTIRDFEAKGPLASSFSVVDWGRVPYLQAWEQQKELVEKRVRDEIGDTLVVCEHDPVITLGRGSQRGERPVILDPTIPVVEIERGGLATYHGPGQIVV